MDIINLNNRTLGIFCLLVLCTFQTTAQVDNTASNKGSLFFYWGWNRGFYTHSDYHFKGPGYDFILSDVAAKDKPKKVNLDSYMNPANLTIPQTNFRVGYFFHEHYSISFGFDHMKYVMIQNQDVIIDGYISGTQTIYDGVYNKEVINLSRRFLQYEHTDGLNYMHFEIRRHDQVLNLGKLKVNIQEGLGIGALMPRTSAKFINNPKNDDYHLSGCGLNLTLGINTTFYEHFFLQSEIKGGYISLPSVKFTDSLDDKVSQSFFFSQLNFVFGFRFNLIKKRDYQS